MTYFNPAIYNKENLKDKDRKELEYYQEVFNNVITNTQADFCNADFGGNSPTMQNILNEVIQSFCEALRADLGYAMQEQAVGIIESYEDDSVEERKEYTTFLYDKEDQES